MVAEGKRPPDPGGLGSEVGPELILIEKVACFSRDASYPFLGRRSKETQYSSNPTSARKVRARLL